MKVFKKLRIPFLSSKKKGDKKLIEVPPNTDCLWKLSDVVVPEHLLNSKPRKSKITEYTKRFEELGYIDKPILVQKDNSYPNSPFVFLQDQYIRWIIANKRRLEYIPIQWINS